MLPGKQYTVDDLVLILRRRYWLILVPIAVVGAAVAAFSQTRPNVYSAETVILVEAQRIPENYVKSTVTTGIEDRLPTLETMIKSRTRLEPLIEQFNLYPEERRAGPMEDVVALMRRNITTGRAGGNTFRVVYTGSDPLQVMKVTEGLASLFINESLVDRQLQAEGTNEFLDSQLLEARSKLEEQERRLAAWKMSHAGELPTQYGANVQQAQNAQMGLRDLRASMNLARNRRLELERQLGDLQNPAAVSNPGSVPNPIVDPAVAAATAGTAKQLSTAEAQVAAFEQRGYRAGHPDLEAARRRVTDLQVRLQERHGRHRVFVGPAVAGIDG